MAHPMKSESGWNETGDSVEDAKRSRGENERNLRR